MVVTPVTQVTQVAQVFLRTVNLHRSLQAMLGDRLVDTDTDETLPDVDVESRSAAVRSESTTAVTALDPAALHDVPMPFSG